MVNYKYYIELVLTLVIRNLKIRYKSSILGYFWALANPLCFALVYFIAFKYILRVQMESYSLFILTGIFPWVWFSNSVTKGTLSLRDNASLVKKIQIKKYILPLVTIIEELVYFIFAFPVIIAFVYFSGLSITFSDLALWGVTCLLQFLLLAPIIVTFSILNVFVNDIEYMLGIFISMLFFLCPIVYPISLVPGSFLWLYELNPITSLLEIWRHIFMGTPMRVSSIFNLLAFILILNFMNLFIYSKLNRYVGEAL